MHTNKYRKFNGSKIIEQTPIDPPTSNENSLTQPRSTYPKNQSLTIFSKTTFSGSCQSFTIRYYKVAKHINLPNCPSYIS